MTTDDSFERERGAAGTDDGPDDEGIRDSDRGPFEWVREVVERDGGPSDEGRTDSDDGPATPATVRSNGTDHADHGTDQSEPDIVSPVLDSDVSRNGDSAGELSVPEVERMRSIIEGTRGGRTDVAAARTDDGTLDPLGLGQLGEDAADLFLPGDFGEGVTELFLPGQTGTGVADVPRIARVVAESTWRVSDYSMQAQMRASHQIADAVATSQSPDELLTELLDVAEGELEHAEAELRRQGIDRSDPRRTTEYGDRGTDHRLDTTGSVEDPPASTDSMPDWVSGDGRDTPVDTDTAGTPASTATDPDTPTSPTPTATNPDAAGSSGRRSTLEGVAESLPDISTSWVREVTSGAPLVFGAVRRAVDYSVRAQARTARRLWRTAASADSPDALLDETLNAAVEEGERLGFDIEQDISDRIAGRRSVTSADADEAARLLSERGSQLLHQSADTDAEERIHPAYAHMLKQVSADEARILRLLATEGRQPAVDVRSKRLVLGSELVAESLSMVGIEAGCHDPDRASVYLENLERLGLVRIADEPLDNLKRYQLLEAQPDVAEAEEEAGRASIVYRSICLTSLGADFCRVCLSVDADAERATGASANDDE